MSLKKILVIAVTALTATAFLGTSAQAARVKWKMHSAWGSQVPTLGYEAVRFADDITAASGGDADTDYRDAGLATVTGVARSVTAISVSGIAGRGVSDGVTN